jgi:hypothetical protein
MGLLFYPMEYISDRLKEMGGIFRELSLENQSLLLKCSQLSQIAENAVKKAFSGRCPYDAEKGENRERAVHRSRSVCRER